MVVRWWQCGVPQAASRKAPVAKNGPSIFGQNCKNSTDREKHLLECGVLTTVNHENDQDAAGVRVAFLVAARVRLRRAKTRESCLIEV